MVRTASIAAILVLCVAGCDLGTVPPTSGPSRSAVPPVRSATPATTGPPTDPPADPPTPAATEPPSEDAPARPDPATFLQVCRADDLAAVRPVPCADIVEAALGARELAGARVDRVETGGTCDPAGSCRPFTATPSAWVTVLSDRDPLIVRVGLGADGGLSVTEVHPAIPPEPPGFSPPPAGLAPLPGAPASLAGRPAYPLCGTEHAPMGGPYDERGRACFLTGVLAGSSVEFASLGTGTEGGAVVTLYRFGGAGGIELVTGEGGTWMRSHTGIADAGGGLVFDVGGMSTASEPVP